MLRYLLLFFSVLAFSQQYKSVDFIICDAIVSPNFNEKSIYGEVTYEFKVLEKIDTISIDAVAMDFTEVKINNKKVPFVYDGKHLKLYKGFKKKKNIISFTYTAKPKQTMYFVGNEEDFQIWTQGQGKYTSHWLPSFDDVNEKVIFNVNIIFDKKMNVLANGKSYKKLDFNTTFSFKTDGKEIVRSFKMKKPMSSYLVMLAIGDFIKQTETTSSGTVLEYYLDRKDSLKFEPTYRHSKQIFEFLEQEIGIKYPWEVYRQVP
ncbi:MAG: M1 family peptidase, partial [Flavobacteriaceae bacterium]|nr:M1 family peptidase [Flavobacteriaceae bacterium]